MSTSRRFFLVGAGALITTSFVSKAVAYAERTSKPLLVTPDRIEGELFIYEDGRISLGPFILFDNEPVPTWRQRLAQETGKPIETISDAIAAGYPDLTEQELDTLLDEFGWADSWEYMRSPTARAYRLLDSLDLGLLRHRPRYTRDQNFLTFIQSFHPLDSSHVVFAQDPETERLDPVTASLLQARLVELGTGLRLVQGIYEDFQPW
jgi:hypothetical protein